MRFLGTAIEGVHLIEVDKHEDARGSFTRIYCADEFQANGLELPDRQMAISHNPVRGTLRGLHFIDEAIGEAKLVRCIKGTVFDVAVDLRAGSPTYGDYFSVRLDADQGNAIHLPRGVAHGFLSLVADCDILYQFSQPHRPGLEKGVRWNDPDLAIEWPCAPTLLSKRDQSLPSLRELSN